MPGTVKKEKDHYGSLKKGKKNLRVKWYRHFVEYGKFERSKRDIRKHG